MISLWLQGNRNILTGINFLYIRSEIGGQSLKKTDWFQSQGPGRKLNVVIITNFKMKFTNFLMWKFLVENLPTISNAF